MKRVSLLLAAASLVLAISAPLASAGDGEVTLKGEGKCAKCALKETEACQNAVVVMKDGASVVYYMAANDVSKAFHKNICRGSAKVVAKGTVKDEGGKKVLTPTSIELDPS